VVEVVLSFLGNCFMGERYSLSSYLLGLFECLFGFQEKTG
jgi:hypothetical protein